MKWFLALSLVGCSTDANLGNSIVAPRAEWSLAVGGRGYEQGDAVAFDGNGDVVVGGLGHLGTIDFGRGAEGTLGTWAFVAKRSGVDGSAVWDTPITGVEPDAEAEITDLAVAANGDIYVTGGYMGTVDFGGTTLQTPYHVSGDMFVARYTRDGALAWVRGLGSSSHGYSAALAIDASSNVYVAGIFRLGTFSFLGQTYTSGDSQDGFVVSYASDGSPRWIDVMDPHLQNDVRSIAVSPTGDVIFDGGFTSTITLDRQVLQTASTGGFIARYHSDGSYLWGETLDVTASAVGRLTVDSSDQIAVELTPGADDGSDDQRPELIVLRPSGEQTATYSRGSSLTRCHAARPDGALIVPSWDDQVELSTVDSSGHANSSSFGKLLTESSYAAFRDVAFGPSGEVALVGDIQGELLLGPTAIAAHGTNDTDALVVLIPPSL